ncbi:MAG: Gx transporter family protein [Lachnospiraceae bacterium]|nr:Gx transporter family protein [Lachnospiraceae bacterium]
MSAKKTAALGVLLCVALILSYLENLLLPPIPVPGIKIGLGNLAVVTVLYFYSWKEAGVLNLMRILILTLLFGNAMGLAFSLTGAVLSFAVMCIIKRSKNSSVMLVSMAGGVVHNVGQLLAALLFFSVNLFWYYLPVMLVAGLVTGALIGLVAGVVIRRCGPFIKETGI